MNRKSGETGKYLKIDKDGRSLWSKKIHKLELAYSQMSDKIAAENKRLFEEKDKEMKTLEKKLILRIQKTCIAKALWVME